MLGSQSRCSLPAIPRAPPRPAASRRVADESGATMVLSLFMAIAMVTFGGIAVDVAQYEYTRTRTQTHLGNAVLAAAGIDTAALAVEITSERPGGRLVGRTVDARLDGGVDTHFIRLLGYDRLPLGVASRATGRVDDVEISLVLDVSGSMRLDPWGRADPRKIDALKSAASEFVDSVLGGNAEGRVSISVVPYSMNVNAGAALLAGYAATDEHAASHCIDFEAADFATAALDPARPPQRSGRFQFQGFSRTEAAPGQWACRVDPGFEVTPLSNAAGPLEDRIARLSSEGSTSNDIGMRWELALLDPSARGPVEGLIAAGRVDPAFAGRPRDHGATGSMKVPVVMTDGRHDTEFRLRPACRDGPSPVWQMAATGSGSRHHSVDAPEVPGAHDGNAPFGARCFYASHPFGTSRAWDDATLIDHPAMAPHRARFTERRLDWPQVWAAMSPLSYAYTLQACSSTIPATALAASTASGTRRTAGCATSVPPPKRPASGLFHRFRGAGFGIAGAAARLRLQRGALSRRGGAGDPRRLRHDRQFDQHAEADAMTGRLQRFARGAEGGVTAEFVVLFPLLLYVVLLAFEVGCGTSAS